MAATGKKAKYAALLGSYMFKPIALEYLGPTNESAVQFLSDLGHRITSVSADDKEAQFLFQRLSIARQRFNAVSVDALHSTWRRTVFRSLQLPPGNICVLLFVISWRYRLTASARTVVGLSQLPARRRGTHCQHTFAVWRTAPLHLDDYLKTPLFSEY